ncbi:MAG: PIN domain-containing protein [Candidatus Omnitrophica bacterium]|nr:PIN domain-containing protein [Candidatus Omnitrophota bacterium]
MGTPFYVDTSVWNYAVAPEMGESYDATIEFFEHAGLLDWNLIVSELVEIEVEQTPGLKKTSIKSFMDNRIGEVLPVTLEIRDLAMRYIAEGVVTSNHLNDAIHVAAASVNQCDFLVTWNFKHLANIRKETKFLAVNALSGYNGEIRICTPLEVYEI